MLESEGLPPTLKMQPKESGNDYFFFFFFNPEGLTLKFLSSKKPQEEEKQIWDQNISMVAGRALAMPWAGPGSRPRSNQLQLQGPSGEGKAGDTHPKAAEQDWGSPYLTRETGLAGGGQSSVRVHRGQITC